MNLDNKKIVTTENKSILSSNETGFHYSQSGKTIIGKYKGGSILEGPIIGKQTKVWIRKSFSKGKSTLTKV